jgi:hypothetical protein
MKKLLLSFLLLSPFAFSDSKQIKVIDYDADTKITVYCISGYAFTQYDKTALVQMMKEGGVVLEVQSQCLMNVVNI